MENDQHDECVLTQPRAVTMKANPVQQPVPATRVFKSFSVGGGSSCSHRIGLASTLPKRHSPFLFSALPASLLPLQLSD